MKLYCLGWVAEVQQGLQAASLVAQAEAAESSAVLVAVWARKRGARCLTMLP